MVLSPATGCAAKKGKWSPSSARNLEARVAFILPSFPSSSSFLASFLPSFLSSFLLVEAKQETKRHKRTMSDQQQSQNAEQKQQYVVFLLLFLCLCVFFFVLFNRSPCFACFLLPNFIFFCACVVLRLSWCCSCCLAIAHAFVLLWLIFKGQLCCCVEATQAKVTSTSAPCPENCKARQGLCVCVCVCMSECVSVSQCV